MLYVPEGSSRGSVELLSYIRDLASSSSVFVSKVCVWASSINKIKNTLKKCSRVLGEWVHVLQKVLVLQYCVRVLQINEVSL